MARASIVLPVPGKASSSRWPSDSMQVRASRTTCPLPSNACSTFAAIASNVWAYHWTCSSVTLIGASPASLSRVPVHEAGLDGAGRPARDHDVDLLAQVGVERAVVARVAAARQHGHVAGVERAAAAGAVAGQRVAARRDALGRPEDLVAVAAVAGAGAGVDVGDRGLRRRRVVGLAVDRRPVAERTRGVL